MNIWAAYFGSYNNENIQFPFRSVKGIIFESKEKAIDYVVARYGNDPSQGLYYSVLSLCPIDLFVDEQIQDFIQRYLFCEKFNVQPFPGQYDDQPAIWVDFCRLMGEEIMKCQKEANRLGK